MSSTTPKEADTIGGHTPLTDWLGAKLRVGDWIIYPSESSGTGLNRTATQMVLGEIVALHRLLDGGEGLTVRVLRRSRTAPSRQVVYISPVGLCNVTRIAPSGVRSSTETDE